MRVWWNLATQHKPAGPFFMEVRIHDTTRPAEKPNPLPPSAIPYWSLASMLHQRREAAGETLPAPAVRRPRIPRPRRNSNDELVFSKTPAAKAAREKKKEKAEERKARVAERKRKLELSEA